MAFFQSEVVSGVIGGRFFVTAEVRAGKRGYTVREARDNGAIENLGEFHAHQSRVDALMAAEAEVRRRAEVGV